MGRTSSKAGGGASKVGAAPSFNTPKNIANAQNAISNLGSKRSTSASFINPRDGHKIDAYVEKVTARDYWGKSTGRSFYKVVVHDGTTNERLWYNTGVEKLSQVKDDIYRVTGVPKKSRR